MKDSNQVQSIHLLLQLVYVYIVIYEYRHVYRRVGCGQDAWDAGRTCGTRARRVGRGWDAGGMCGTQVGCMGRRQDVWDTGRTCGPWARRVGRGWEVWDVGR